MQKRFVVPIILAALCALLVGGWRSDKNNALGKNGRSEIKRSNGAQLVATYQSEASAATLGTSDSAVAPARKVPASPSGHDVTGSLNDQLERAFATKDGPLAARVAAQLEECQISQGILEIQSLQGAYRNPYPETPNERMERLSGYQRNIAHCQTVPGDPIQARLRLLDLAMQQGVMGAARERFLAGSRDSATISHLVSDAQAGDDNSLMTVSLYDAKVFSIAQEDQDALRYALKLASLDPDVGEYAARKLHVAESHAVPDSHFDFSAISSEARAKGAEIAERLKLKLGQKMS